MIFNGVDILSVDKTISINKEIPPGMPRREIHTIRGNASEHLGGITRERDDYIVRVNIAAKTADEAWLARGKLAAWAMSSGEETAQLVPTHRTDVAYDAIVSSISAPEFKRGFATVTVTFLLPDPVCYDRLEQKKTGSGTITLTIGGTQEAEPIVTITPASQATFVRCTMDSQKSMTLRGTFEANVPVEIDFAQGRVSAGGVDMNETISFEESSWKLGFTPGEHRLVCTGAAEVRWRNRWA